MPTQKDSKKIYTLDDWISSFQKDPRSAYKLEFVKCDGLTKYDLILNDSNEELVILSLTTVENSNLFIAVSGRKKEFNVLDLKSVVKELADKEDAFQSAHISLGTLTFEKSIAIRSEKEQARHAVLPFIKEKLGSKSNSAASDNNTNNEQKSSNNDDNDTTDDNDDNFVVNVPEPKAKVQFSDASNSSNADDTDEFEATETNETNNKSKESLAASTSVVDSKDSFDEVEQNIFEDNIHATFGDLVDCLSDNDADAEVTESYLKDNKVLINFKLLPLAEMIIRSKTTFIDTSYDAWNEFSNDKDTVSKKSKLILEDMNDYNGGYLVDGTMTSVSFDFTKCDKMIFKWEDSWTKVKANPTIDSIVSLLLANETPNSVKVTVIDKLSNDSVVQIYFEST